MCRLDLMCSLSILSNPQALPFDKFDTLNFFSGNRVVYKIEAGNFMIFKFILLNRCDLMDLWRYLNSLFKCMQ